MCTRASGTDPSPRLSAWLVAAMLAMVAVPAAITLRAVRSPGTLQVPGSDPTPYGYTWSLLLFIVPIVVIGFWFVPAEGVEIPRRAFWRTIGVLVPLGFGLDFFFAQRFFVFRQLGRDFGDRSSRLGRAGSGRGVHFLLHWLPLCFADLCLAGRILAGGLQRSRLPGRSQKDLSPAPVPSDVRDRWSAPDLDGRRLQENVLAGSRRLPRLLYRARGWRVSFLR